MESITTTAEWIWHDQRMLLCQWIALLIMITGVVFVAKLKSLRSSTIYTMKIMVVFNTAMVLYRPYTESITTLDNIQSIWFAWFMGFAVLDMISILLVWLIHYMKNLKYSFLSIVIMITLAFTGLVQLATYRVLVNTDLSIVLAGGELGLIVNFYEQGMPVFQQVMSMGILSISLIMILMQIINRYKNNTTIKRSLTWLI